VSSVSVLLITLCGIAQDTTKQKDKEISKENPKDKIGFRSKSWDEVADAAIEYLKTTQAEDGTWSKSSHPGITAMVVTGLLKSGKINVDSPMVANALKYLEGFINEKEGHMAGDDKVRHKYYMTSVNLLAFKASGLKKYDVPIAKAVTYFKKGQVGAEDGTPQDDPNYGGFGYGPRTRADMSNTHFVLDALVAAKVDRSDEVFKKALLFVSRSQNLKSEFNTLPWAGRINDGSFVYVNGISPGGKSSEDAPRPGYGSMTYAGLKSLKICGVNKEDIRYKKALEWIGKNYNVDYHPGRGEGAGGQGYYYYLVSMAKCFDTLGIEEIVDANGKAHDWRAEITRALANRQRKDGSWGNDFTLWMEGDSNLDTAYALIALSYTKPKSK
jgi:squalene-hopene/tetraprenyl-beta-curcumene cyclase